MRLDKRIKDFKVLTPFSTMKEIEPYIGKECYFADHLADFKSLEQYCKKAVLDRCIFGDYNENRYPFRINDNTEDVDDFGFCLPCDFIKEVSEEKPLKYRPYTVKELPFTVGDIMFIKDKESPTINKCICSCITTINDTISLITLGTVQYSVYELFENYRWKFNEFAETGDWNPFGEVVDGK